MREIRVEKVVLNVGCGTKLKIETAKAMLEKITGRKAVITKTKRRTTFNVPKNKEIGCKVTIRNDLDFLKNLLEAKENRLDEHNFDNTGNVSFGVKEYIDVPKMEYDPKLGILGFDVSVSLERKGFRVKRKKIARKIGKRHKITKDEAIVFIKEKFNVAVEKEEEEE